MTCGHAPFPPGSGLPRQGGGGRAGTPGRPGGAVPEPHGHTVAAGCQQEPATSPRPPAAPSAAQRAAGPASRAALRGSKSSARPGSRDSPPSERFDSSRCLHGRGVEGPPEAPKWCGEVKAAACAAQRFIHRSASSTAARSPSAGFSGGSRHSPAETPQAGDLWGLVLTSTSAGQPATAETAPA